ncbi:valyl-tRNA synthetase [Desulfitispora alkaliphila]|uniref:valine--tRNA ligase n=1 Tax=Desulfitispora alkaliphila TaxID=622674 RepID=UPI003D20A99B
MTEQKNISTTYNPSEVETKWYEHWENSGYFTPSPDETKKPYTIVMPPPNVTGSLHLGHALDNTLQDILIRWKRLQGYSALWVPGTDHAGIATQARVEENLSQEGISKYDLGREKFLDKVWDWKEQYGGRITRQLRLLGASCDWSRERFTMDEGCSDAVLEVFVQLYKKGLIYRGNRIINWCPKCQTTISDIEVEHKDSEGSIYHMAYPVKDSDETIVVATTRPETMLGDTAVAVHPEDERYKHLVGKTVILPIVDREIPIIADDYVDPEFGTGAVKITPAHDVNDFEMGERHKLPHVVVIGKDAIMTEEAGIYQGMDRYQCRQQLVDDLKAQGILTDVESHENAVGQCYRCDTVIEPLVSQQWFVDMKPLAEPAIKAVEEGQIRFVPQRFSKTYLRWLEDIRDWCISRQLWWGHRIPVWYCQECGEIICTKEDPNSCHKCQGDKLEQDPDVLDTWFSSGLWPFSTLGWPQNTEDLKYYYPTSALVTGRDIIFFWVARMIFTSLEFMDEEPFKEVFIHGLILDSQGRKMSKSLGNGVDPIEIIEQYGADTLRFMLITGNTPGNDIRFHFERLEATRNFANKIWNASRFVLMNLADYEPGKGQVEYQLADKWVLSKYNQTIAEVNRLMDNYELGEAGRTLYDFIWNQFCDWYIELAKPRLYGHQTEVSKYTAQSVLHQVLSGTMTLLHPFMPFITEEIWQCLPHEEESIMISNWPQVDSNKIDAQIETQMEMLMEVIKGVRNIRGEMNVPPSKKAEIIIDAADEELATVLEQGKGYIELLANGEPVNIHVNLESKPDKAATAVVKGIEVFVPLMDLIDLDVEISRLEKEKTNLNKELKRVEGKLNNQGFLAKAPEAVVAKEQEKKKEYEQKLQAVLNRLEMLK